MEILCKNLAKFQTWNLTFLNFFKKSALIFQKISNLFTLNLIWANFEQDQSTFFFEKKGLCSSVNLKKKSKNSRIFQLEIGFFSDFAKKTSNVPKNSKFICPELHLSQFSAKLKELFWSVSHSVTHYHSLRSRPQVRAVVVRGTARERLGTARARLAGFFF